eukprot:2339737-Prymnesium_polylepis.1
MAGASKWDTVHGQTLHGAVHIPVSKAVWRRGKGRQGPRDFSLPFRVTASGSPARRKKKKKKKSVVETTGGGGG